jgi:hypothetical protein
VTFEVKQLSVAALNYSLCAGLCLLSLALSGCGSQAYQSAPVDAAKAIGTLSDVMDSWKSGETPESLQDLKPPIVVQDFDWAGGMKLLDYQIVGDGKPVNANLSAEVKLTLEDKSGAKLEKTVKYLVSTAPSLTVFRDSFQ